MAMPEPGPEPTPGCGKQGTQGGVASPLTHSSAPGLPWVGPLPCPHPRPSLAVPRVAQGWAEENGEA